MVSNSDTSATLDCANWHMKIGEYVKKYPFSDCRLYIAVGLKDLPF